MSSIGWEFWGIKFSWLVTALVSIVATLYVLLTTHRHNASSRREDTMAGDEGEEW